MSEEEYRKAEQIVRAYEIKKEKEQLKLEDAAARQMLGKWYRHSWDNQEYRAYTHLIEANYINRNFTAVRVTVDGKGRVDIHPDYTVSFYAIRLLRQNKWETGDTKELSGFDALKEIDEAVTEALGR